MDSIANNKIDRLQLWSVHLGRVRYIYDGEMRFSLGMSNCMDPSPSCHLVVVCRLSCHILQPASIRPDVTGNDAKQNDDIIIHPISDTILCMAKFKLCTCAID